MTVLKIKKKISKNFSGTFLKKKIFFCFCSKILEKTDFERRQLLFEDEKAILEHSSDAFLVVLHWMTQLLSRCAQSGRIWSPETIVPMMQDKISQMRSSGLSV